MVCETFPSLREEKTEKTGPGSQTEVKYKRAPKSRGKACNRDSETSERALGDDAYCAHSEVIESRLRALPPNFGALLYFASICEPGPVFFIFSSRREGEVYTHLVSSLLRDTVARETTFVVARHFRYLTACFGAPGRVFWPLNPRFASVRVQFWYGPYFHC